MSHPFPASVKSAVSVEAVFFTFFAAYPGQDVVVTTAFTQAAAIIKREAVRSVYMMILLTKLPPVSGFCLRGIRSWARLLF